MDNRQDMTHTREIDLLELLMTVLIHWRSMIVVMMCGVIVLGGMSYIKSVQNIQNIQSRNEKLQQEEQYFNELSGKSEAELRELFAEKMTEEEITNVENAFYTNSNIMLKNIIWKRQNLCRQILYICILRI